jgi:hypothetical protein
MHVAEAFASDKAGKKRPGIAPGLMLGLPVVPGLDSTPFRLFLRHWRCFTQRQSEQDTRDVVPFFLANEVGR